MLLCLAAFPLRLLPFTSLCLFTLCLLSRFPLHALLLLLLILLLLLLVLLLLLSNLLHRQVSLPFIPRPDSFAVIAIITTITTDTATITATAPSGEGRTASTNRHLSRRTLLP